MHEYYSGIDPAAHSGQVSHARDRRASSLLCRYRLLLLRSRALAAHTPEERESVTHSRSGSSRKSRPASPYTYEFRRRGLLALVLYIKWREVGDGGGGAYISEPNPSVNLMPEGRDALMGNWISFNCERACNGLRAAACGDAFSRCEAGRFMVLSSRFC